MKSYFEILRHVQASYLGSTKQSVILGSQSILQIHFLKPISLYLTPFFVRAGLTPNQVTWLGFVVGLASCALLASGPEARIVLGAWLYLVHRVLDHVDGNIARYSKRMSLYGHFLDGSLGVIIQMGLFLSVGIGIYRQCQLNVGWAPQFVQEEPEIAILAGAVASSVWMVARFIKLFYDGMIEKGGVGPSAEDADAPVKTSGFWKALWRRTRAVNGIVPVIRVIGLIVAAYTDTLVIYLGFFLLYVPASFAFQFVRLLVQAAASLRPAPVTDRS